MPSTIFPSPDSVREMLLDLLPLLSRPSLPPPTLRQLHLLCQQVKQVGPQLEVTCRTQLDDLQTLLTGLCQDKRLDVLLRLQLLELIELRSLGWRSNQAVDTYYSERFNMFGGDQKKEEEKQKIVQRPSLSSISEQNVGEFQQSRETITVDGVELIIRCSNPSITQTAKKVVENHFMPRPIQYSKETLLQLATSPVTREPPVHWEDVVGSLPSILVRSRFTSAPGSGDSGRLGSRLRPSQVPRLHHAPQRDHPSQVPRSRLHHDPQRDNPSQ